MMNLADEADLKQSMIQDIENMGWVSEQNGLKRSAHQ